MCTSIHSWTWFVIHHALTKLTSGYNIQCTFADVICVTGDVRLVGGSNPLEGRLEVCFYNQWGTMCSNGSMWTANEAVVACRQLGYAGESKETNIIFIALIFAEYSVLCQIDCRCSSC